MLLEVSHLFKSYPGLPVLHDVSLTADAGEIVCLLGPSGCGKTTLLRIVAGLESPDAGRVTFAGQDLTGVPAHRRNFGLMFQDYALFPHRDVAANVAFGLRMQRRAAGETTGRVREMLALVALAGYEARRVTDLSGGEQQRVALARSLAPGPQLLMLDEPLGALDRALREQLLNELRLILKRVGVTALYVTHDQEEAFAVADRVVIMRPWPERGEGGRVEQIGTPPAVYRHPATAYVAQFLGFRNLLDGVVVEEEQGSGGAEARGSRGAGERERGGGAVWQAESPATLLAVETPLGRLAVGDAAGGHGVGEQVTVLIRPEAADVRPAGETGPNIVPGRLLERSFRGSYYLIRTEHAGGVTLTCEASMVDAALPAAGAEIALRLDPAAITLL